MASYLGTSHLADAFAVAFKLPNFFRTIFAEGALSAAFIPIFSNKLTSEGKKEASIFASYVLLIFFFLLVAIVIIFEIFMPEIMKILAPGFIAHKEKFEFVIVFARITFPYLLFISIITIITGILNSFGKFAVAAAIPLLLNVCMTFAIIFLSKYTKTPAHALAIGALFSGIVQLYVVIFSVRREGFVFTFKFPKLDDNIRLLFKNMLPAIVGSSITQINLWIGTIIASKVAGAVAIMYYGERLNQFPLAIIGTALGTILLPSLSKSLKEGNIEKANNIQIKCLKIGLLLALPSCFGLIFIGDLIVEMLLQRNEFTYLDTKNVSDTLAILALGLPAFVMIKIFTPRFFANLDTKTPVKISLVSVLVNIIVSILLVKDYKFLGIAFATALSGWVNLIMLVYFLHIKHSFHFIKITYKTILKQITSAFFMGISLFFLKPILLSMIAYKILALLLLMIIGSLLYFFSYFVVLRAEFRH